MLLFIFFSVCLLSVCCGFICGQEFILHGFDVSYVLDLR